MAVHSMELGRLSEDEVRDALERPEVPVDFGVAPAEWLILWDVVWDALPSVESPERAMTWQPSPTRAEGAERTMRRRWSAAASAEIEALLHHNGRRLGASIGHDVLRVNVTRSPSSSDSRSRRNSLEMSSTTSMWRVRSGMSTAHWTEASPTVIVARKALAPPKETPSLRNPRMRCRSKPEVSTALAASRTSSSTSKVSRPAS